MLIKETLNSVAYLKNDRSHLCVFWNRDVVDAAVEVGFVVI